MTGDPNEVKSILCVHQGFELYGSDRSFLQSVKLLKRCYPEARITAILPEHGPLTEHLQALVDELVVREMAILRRGELLGRLPAFVKGLPGRVRLARVDCSKHDLIYINTVVVLDFILASWLPGGRAFIHVREAPGILARTVFSLLLAPSRAGLIFNSRFTKRIFSLVRWKSSCVIHNAAEDFHSIKPVDAGGDGLKVLLLGRFNAMKGQKLLLEAVAGMSEGERRSLKIRMVGNAFRGQECHEGRIREQVVQDGLEEIVEMMDFCACPAELFEWADVVVVPSTRPESFGRTAIEAMSAGRCVIAADHGGVLEIITPAVDGLLFKANDAVDLRDQIRRLLNDREMVSRMGRQGRAKFRSRFTEQCYEEKLASLLTTGNCSCEDSGIIGISD